LGIFGSIDMNRGDAQLGWDTDQFPNNLSETALAMYYILQGGGFTTGGLNFDAKIRRQSLDPADLLHGHVGGIDTSARALLVAERMIKDGALQRHLDERYAGWNSVEGKAILAGQRSLGDLAALVEASGLDPQPRSGRQEYLENLVNRYL
jgi:xylose isomerase